MLRSPYTTVFVFCILCGCAPPEPSSDSEAYFDMAGVIDKQIAILDTLAPRVRKEAQIGNEFEKIEITPDSAQWVDELKIFRNADINKPVLRGEYEIKDELSEPSSNLKIRLYEAKDKTAGLRVEYIKVYYVENPDDIRRIEASVQEGNALFKGQTKLLLEFRENGRRQLLLHKYRIEGAQKMVTIDSVYYRVEAEVL